MGEFEWDLAPTEYQLIQENDPLDMISLTVLLDETNMGPVQNFESMEDRRPYFQLLSDQTVGVLYNDGFFPQNYIIDEQLPQPVVPIPDGSNISVLTPDLVLDPEPDKNFWDDEDFIDIWVGEEEWTIGKTTN